MNQSDPFASVSMVAYNVEKYVGEAIEGVLMQRTAFPFELVIGEDCSTDSTRKICEAYARKYPDRIRLLTGSENLGCARNNFRTMKSCRGRYIAICDSDDVWTDPLKLQKQVDFLEAHPDYGMVYTDIDVIDEKGNAITYEKVEQMRSRYAGGDIFFELLKDNLINNITTLFRRELLDGFDGYFVDIAWDYLFWLRVAMRTRIHFMDYPSTSYRIHSGGITRSAERVKRNQKFFMPYYWEILADFGRRNTRPLNKADRSLYFRKLTSSFLRQPSLKGKLEMLGLMLKYHPEMDGLLQLISGKVKKPGPFSRHASH